MRKVQIEIKMHILKEPEETDGELAYSPPEKVSVYADGQNVWEVVCAGMDELLTTLKESHSLPEWGRKEHYDVSRRSSAQPAPENF